MTEKNLRDMWSRATDEQVAKAFRHDKDEYSPEARAVIEEEYTQRILCDYHEPTKADEIKRVGSNFLSILSWIGLCVLAIIVAGLIEDTSQAILEQEQLTDIQKGRLEHIDMFLLGTFVAGLFNKWRKKFLFWYFGITIPVAIIQLIWMLSM